MKRAEWKRVACCCGIPKWTDTIASRVQAANASLKAALAQQEAHVKDLHAQAEAKAAESSGAESRRASEQAQRVGCLPMVNDMIRCAMPGTSIVVFFSSQ